MKKIKQKKDVGELLRDLEKIIQLKKILKECKINDSSELMVTFSLDFQTKLEAFALMPVTSKTYQRTIYGVDYFLSVHQKEPFKIWCCT